MLTAAELKRWARTPQVIRQTREEAERAGATLYHDGHGGIDAGLALHIFRRDQWRCQLCEKQTDLELDHLGGHPHITPEARDHGSEDVEENLVTVCHSCQDVIHAADRALRKES